MYVLELTEKQLRKLEEILECTQDAGPTGEGWASEELAGLRNVVWEASEAPNEVRGHGAVV